MTAKPKTGKAIMTDEEIIKEYDECHIAIEEVIKIAREQGRADLLAEQKFAKPCIDKFSELLEKQAYANGFKEGEIKGLSESITVKGKSHLSYYQQGYALGQSDLSARLMNYSKGNVVYGSSMNAKQIIKQALDEATKEGDK